MWLGCASGFNTETFIVCEQDCNKWQFCRCVIKSIMWPRKATPCIYPLQISLQLLSFPLRHIPYIPLQSSSHSVRRSSGIACLREKHRWDCVIIMKYWRRSLCYHQEVNSFIHQWFYSPLLGPGLLFSFVFFFTQTVGLLGRVISPSQGRYLHTGQHKHRHPCVEWDDH
jgi:hypothetical protein